MPNTRPKQSALFQTQQQLSLPVESNEAVRLFHGRGHAYPGLEHICIDWLSPVILITLFSPEPDNDIQTFAQWLLNAQANCTSVLLQQRYEQLAPIECVSGTPITALTALENGIKFHITLGKSQNTGLFLDMRHGRKWVINHAHQLNILNLFSYTCGFSIAASTGGAKQVVNMDMSKAALEIGRQNHHLNHQSLDNIKFEKVNIFKSFGRINRMGPFDLLICDPPTFQKGSIHVQRDYPKIMRRLNEFMAKESTVVLCLNAPHLGDEFLIDNMAMQAPDFKLSEKISPPEIFHDAQGKGLKMLVFKRPISD